MPLDSSASKSSRVISFSSATTAKPEKPSRWLRFAGTAFILLAAAIAAAPIWIHGPVGGDDFEFHLISWLDAQRSWLHGIPYPHWAPSPNFGAGEPRFVFYPPISWMLGAALGLVLSWTLVPVAMTFLMLAGTGLATRALARQALAEGPATLAGCAALFSGYALFTAYNRTAFGELAGGIWIPLLLLFALRDRNPSAALWRRALDRSALPLALAVAGAWLSDAPVGVMASYLLAAVALVAAVLARSWFPVVRATVAALLGIALTGIYLIPAAWEQRWVDIQQATGAKGDPGLHIENNWLFPHHSDAALHMRDLSLRAVSWIGISMIAIALIGALALWWRGKGPSVAKASVEYAGLMRGLKPPPPSVSSFSAPRFAYRFWIPLALIPAAALFLLLPISLPIWNLVPKLRFLQFPWRWLLVVEAPMGIFLAAAAWPGNARKRWLRPTVVCLCATIFLAFTTFAAQHFFRDAPEDDDFANLLKEYSSGSGFVGSDEYAPPGAENSLVAMGLPDACLTDNFDDEQGVAPTPQDNPVWLPEQHSCISTATSTQRGPEHLRVDTVAVRAGFMVLRLRSYPAWRITVNGLVVSGLQARDDGLIAVPVQQGPVRIDVDWTATPDVIAGRCLSALAVLGLLGLAQWSGGRSRVPSAAKAGSQGRI
jgi:hypothetical protein